MQNRKINIYIGSTDLKLFSTMVKSGISPVEAISGISEKYGEKKKRHFDLLKEKLSQGISFSEIFKETNIGKNTLYISLLNSAQKNGNIPEVLQIIALNIESNKQRRDQIVGILIYPFIVLVIVFVLIITLLLYIVPNISPVIAMNNSSLPIATKTLVFLSKQLKLKWLHMIAFLVGTLITLFSILNLKISRLIIEKTLFRIPILKDFILSYLSLGYTLAIYQSLTATVDLAGVFKDINIGARSLVFKNEFKVIEDEIRQGKSLYLALSKSRYIPSSWSLFSKVAEQTSSYSNMFKNLNEYYKEVFESIARLVMRLAEPTLMLIIGLVVGILAYGIMAPLYGIMNSLK